MEPVPWAVGSSSLHSIPDAEGPDSCGKRPFRAVLTFRLVYSSAIPPLNTPPRETTRQESPGQTSVLFCTIRFHYRFLCLLVLVFDEERVGARAGARVGDGFACKETPAGRCPCRRARDG